MAVLSGQRNSFPFLPENHAQQEMTVLLIWSGASKAKSPALVLSAMVFICVFADVSLCPVGTRNSPKHAQQVHLVVSVCHSWKAACSARCGTAEPVLRGWGSRARGACTCLHLLNVHL